MSRLCAASGAVNLAQGFPDVPCPQELKDAAKRAIDEDVNQYATSFYADPSHGAGQIRFAFPKRLETLHAAAERLAKLR
jgi:aspartate/methionine/tyrosine aminotransferase